jgi:hypothetical protein
MQFKVHIFSFSCRVYFFNANLFCSFNIMKIVVWDKLVTRNLSIWGTLAEESPIVVMTMLNANRHGKFARDCVL